jgi:hypothetical protein
MWTAFKKQKKQKAKKTKILNKKILILKKTKKEKPA